MEYWEGEVGVRWMNDRVVFQDGIVALGMRRVPGMLAEDPFLLT